ncbi:ABC transporter permease [Parapusillimonas granuli]|uniref:ABC transporter permease n=1 Tax=Parapusillimonas granuli TaxID=380911 RepID=A0A853G5D6_9BURK|nr:ABC transporter permease [Parapusillimonas granuli]MBB5214283.1 putative spermidine/putrescine transport system permease protein [Parapusillimonas granuli]NYT51387.1 ABC transporter permease [Parapusillimonas granuli]
MAPAKDPLVHRASPWNLAPAFVVMGLFFSAYAVFLNTSFLEAIPGTAQLGDKITLANYQRYFTSATDLNVLWDTLWISTKLMIASFLLGYPVAYIIVRTQCSALRNFLLVSIVMTFLSGSVTRAYAWLILLGNNGAVNTVLMKLSVIAEPLQLVYNELGVFIALLHFILPFFVLTMMGPLKNINPAYEEAAINLGASRPQSFLLVTLPLSLPGIISASSLAFALALSSFVFPLILGGGRVRMVANSIYEHIFTSFDFPFAAATATIFLIVALFFVWAFATMQRMVVRHHQPAGIQHA